jgi:GntR family transcriptional repressor for pyruvate dehydrogenase complex
MGLLKIRRGDGTYVKKVTIASQLENVMPMIMPSKADFTEILEFRRIIEVENARLAAIRATTEDRKILRQLYGHMNSIETDIQEYANDDIAFHTHIAIATHNSFIQKITSVIHEVLQKMMFQGVKTVGIKTSLSFHEQVLNAIEKRDADGAAAAMQDHINNIINILTK